MAQHLRDFECGPDPHGDTWRVEFGWLQTATSIRHADAVDVKFFLTHGDTRLERVISLPHPALLDLSGRLGVPLTDPWCMKIAALHLRHMIETGEDFEKTLVTPPAEALEAHAHRLGGG